MSQTAIELATHPANAREVAFDVTGMTCASCVRRIEKALRGVDGVEQAAVNLATEKATIRYDATRTGMDQLKGAVEHPLDDHFLAVVRDEVGRWHARGTGRLTWADPDRYRPIGLTRGHSGLDRATLADDYGE